MLTRPAQAKQAEAAQSVKSACARAQLQLQTLADIDFLMEQQIKPRPSRMKEFVCESLMTVAAWGAGQVALESIFGHTSTAGAVWRGLIIGVYGTAFIKTFPLPMFRPYTTAASALTRARAPRPRTLAGDIFFALGILPRRADALRLMQCLEAEGVVETEGKGGARMVKHVRNLDDIVKLICLEQKIGLDNQQQRRAAHTLRAAAAIAEVMQEHSPTLWRAHCGEDVSELLPQVEADMRRAARDAVDQGSQASQAVLAEEGRVAAADTKAQSLAQQAWAEKFVERMAETEGWRLLPVLSGSLTAASAWAAGSSAVALIGKLSGLGLSPANTAAVGAFYGLFLGGLFSPRRFNPLVPGGPLSRALPAPTGALQVRLLRELGVTHSEARARQILERLVDLGHACPPLTGDARRIAPCNDSDLRWALSRPWNEEASDRAILDHGEAILCAVRDMGVPMRIRAALEAKIAGLRRAGFSHAVLPSQEERTLRGEIESLTRRMEAIAATAYAQPAQEAAQKSRDGIAQLA